MPLKINSPNGGSVTLDTATANARTVSLPDATDTLVGRATTDTLTNKTLNSPTISGSGITFPSTAVQTDTAIGYGQTWTNVTSSRAIGTTYTNSTGRPIQVLITCGQTGTNQNTFFNVNGVAITSGLGMQGVSSAWVVSNCVVPAGATYSLSGSNPLFSWWELR